MRIIREDRNMPIKLDRLNKLKIMDASTGEQLIDLDDKDIIYAPDTENELHRFNIDSCITVSGNLVDTAELAKLLNLRDDEVTLNQVIVKCKEVIGCCPARHHKKRRIQKKWIKKYGFKLMYKPIDYIGSVGDYKITLQDEKTAEYEFDIRNLMPKNISY